MKRKEYTTIAVHPEEVKPFQTPAPHQRELKVLLSPIVHGTSPNLSMGMVTIPPGGSGNVHAHAVEQEAWYVISGSGRLIVGEDQIDLRPEMVAVAPAGVVHQIINNGAEPLKALFIFSPAGPEEAFIAGRD